MKLFWQCPIDGSMVESAAGREDVDILGFKDIAKLGEEVLLLSLC